MINKKLVAMLSIIVVVVSGFVVLYGSMDARAQLNGPDVYDDLTYSGKAGYSLDLSIPHEIDAYEDLIFCLKHAQFKHDILSEGIERYANYSDIKPREVPTKYRTSVQVWVMANSISMEFMQADVEECLTGYTKLLLD